MHGGSEDSDGVTITKEVIVIQSDDDHDAAGEKTTTEMANDEKAADETKAEKAERETKAEKAEWETKDEKAQEKRKTKTNILIDTWASEDDQDRGARAPEDDEWWPEFKRRRAFFYDLECKRNWH